MAAKISKKTKFPNLLHVTHEEERDGSKWFQVREDGVFGIDENDKEIAIYKLVSVGRVNVQRKYVERKKVN